MKKTNCLFTLWVAALCAGTHAYAVGTAPAILSNYGEIQSVKNYSSNPFWNKNSPYNQNFPKPIYATGADLNTGDCNRVVENLVASYCTEHNYCRNLRISDVRPTIMVQLSQLPGHNFATSCGGYIDSAFNKFQKEYGNVSTVNLPKPASQPTNIEIANPFAPKQTAAQKAIADRATELERLQSITTPTAGVHAEYFPKTTADLSFTDRLANTAAGYEPYKDKASYKKPDFLGEDEAFFERLKLQNPTEYCKRRPNEPECQDARTHNIFYVAMGGNTTNCRPTKYETGVGANITCIPIREHSEFIGWCTEYDATSGAFSDCAGVHTIAPTETTDKTFYAKWKCEEHDPAYIETQTKCIDPTGGSGDGDGSGCPTPCPDITNMTQDPTTCKCTCKGLYQPATTDPNKCECSIDTSNLDSTEQSRVATSCECPSTKPNYNSATHQCEEGSATPPTTNEKFVILQCRPKHSTTASPGTHINPTRFDPNSKASFDCANSNLEQKLLDKCFTPCQVSPSAKGYLNQLLLSITPEFCTGYNGHTGSTSQDNVYFFSTKEISPTLTGTGTYVSKTTPIEYTKQQTEQIKNEIIRNSATVADHCKDSKRSWWLYILKENSTTDYEVTETIKLSD